MDEFVTAGHPLGPGEFYIPRLSRYVLPQDVPITLMRFASRFRVQFDAELQVPKRLDLEARFGSLADYVHVEARDLASDVWSFQRFAPAFMELVGQDLTGAPVMDPRYAPYNTRLPFKHAQLLQLKTPFYAMTHIPEGTLDLHRLFIPMSDVGPVITHCLVFAFLS